MAILLKDREKSYYDEKGNILSRIKFVVVNSFEIGDYELFLSGIAKDNELYLSRENVPERIWWFSESKGKIEIKWC